MSPQILEDAFQRVDFDRDIVVKFFVVFSLFEYALKRAGFRTVRRNGDVQPDWDTFARVVDGQFNSHASTELSTAVDYFLNNPTKKQTVSRNQLIFRPTPRPQNICDTEWLSILIRRVRNNLFHGGKIGYDRYRDSFLIHFSIVILEIWALLHPDVEQELRNVQ